MPNHRESRKILGSERPARTLWVMHTSPKVALVTGAGSGIGRAVAQAMLDAGYAVVLVGRRAEALEETARDSGAPADRVLVAPADITDAAAVRALFARVREHFGRLDVLFNNAGGNTPAVPFEDLPVELRVG